MSDVVVTLGDFQFNRFEVPEQIGFGGDQSLVVHRLVGGKRVVDAMGEDPRALEWSGWFVGSSGLDRALYLDGLRKAGKPLVLTWSELRYTVVIHSFQCEFVRAYRLPYRITCEVVSDDTAPITEITQPSPDQLVDDDMTDAGTLVDTIDDPTLSPLMATLVTALATVGTLSTASPSALNTILLPLAAVRTQVGTMLTASDATLAGVSMPGGIVAGGTPAQQVVVLANQISVMQQEPNLILLDRTLGRVSANIAAINTGTSSVTLAGGNLYAVASEQYGDPMGWTALAIANKLTDPELSGVQTLNVPPFSNNTNGILNG
jgi:hypothetical protein